MSDSTATTNTHGLTPEQLEQLETLRLMTGCPPDASVTIAAAYGLGIIDTLTAEIDRLRGEREGLVEWAQKQSTAAADAAPRLRELGCRALAVLQDGRAEALNQLLTMLGEAPR